VSAAPTPTKTDQQVNAEEILRTMQQENGGDLVEDEYGRLRLVHTPMPPAPTS
jgi:hypothetical protein